MVRKTQDPITGYMTSIIKRKMREQKYKMMDAMCPGFRPMLSMQRAMKQMSNAQKKLTKIK